MIEKKGTLSICIKNITSINNALDVCKKIIKGKLLGINNKGSLMLKSKNKILNLYSGNIVL